MMKKCISANFKSPHSLTVLILIKSSKSKISPEIQSPLFAMIPYKKILKNLCLQHAKTQNILYHFPNKECVHGDWSRGRQDINPAIQTCKPVGLCLVSWHYFQRALSLKFCCLQHSFFPLVFYSLCVYSFPWTLSHDTGIFNILGFLLKPRLYLYSSSECFLRGVLQGLSHHLPYIK